MREVETQVVRRNDRACLLDVCPKHFAQRSVKQMRRRVIASRCIAFLHVNLRRHFIINT